MGKRYFRIDSMDFFLLLYSEIYMLSLTVTVIQSAGYVIVFSNTKNVSQAGVLCPLNSFLVTGIDGKTVYSSKY